MKPAKKISIHIKDKNRNEKKIILMMKCVYKQGFILDKRKCDFTFMLTLKCKTNTQENRKKRIEYKKLRALIIAEFRKPSILQKKIRRKATEFYSR